MTTEEIIKQLEESQAKAARQLNSHADGVAIGLGIALQKLRAQAAAVEANLEALRCLEPGDEVQGECWGLLVGSNPEFVHPRGGGQDDFGRAERLSWWMPLLIAMAGKYEVLKAGGN